MLKSFKFIETYGESAEMLKTIINFGKKGTFHLRKNAEDPKQKCIGHLRKSAFRLQQKCVTTNMKTNKETKEDTTATPPPLPARGQAPALQIDRRDIYSVPAAGSDKL